MLDFEVKRCTRRCASTERELVPGEPFFSVLTTVAGEIVRHDFSVEAWPGPPDDAIGWWKSQMPDPNDKKLDWAPSDIILHYFQQLLEREEVADTRYVLALLMIRRRLLRLEETEETENGQQVLVLFCPKNEAEYRIAVSDPTPERIAVIQDELAQLLFAQAK